MTCDPGTVDFEKWAADEGTRNRQVHGTAITRHWLIPKAAAGKAAFAPPCDVTGGDSARHAARLGSFLQLTTPMPHLQAPEPAPAAVTLLTIGRR